MLGTEWQSKRRNGLEWDWLIGDLDSTMIEIMGGRSSCMNSNSPSTAQAGIPIPKSLSLKWEKKHDLHPLPLQSPEKEPGESAGESWGAYCR